MARAGGTGRRARVPDGDEWGEKLSTRKFRYLFTLVLDSSIMEIELEWCYTLLVSEATASPISLDKSKRITER